MLNRIHFALLPRPAATLMMLAILAPTLTLAAQAQSLTWKKLSPLQSPAARAASAMAYDPVSKKVVLFGGFTANRYLNETWTFDGSTWTQQSPSAAPSARAAASIAFDRKTHKLVLFGGFDGSNYLGDTWLWDGATLTWTQAHPKTLPTAVTGPMLFPDPVGPHVDMFGGFDGMFYQNITWRWTGTNWRNLNPSTTPYARSAGVAALDAGRKSVVLFGGLGSLRTDNTWTWDGANWAQQSPSLQPTTRYYMGSAFDPLLREVIVFAGGVGGVDENSTWAWTGTDWTQLQPAKSPAARESLGMAYDAASRQLLIFGGDSPSKFFHDTWKLVGH
jgi:hypothetical protein